MLRASLYSNGQGISNERTYYKVNDWDLDDKMKVWFEYPERTRFAKYGLDILYTPIFFGNEDVSGDICLEANDSLSELLPDLTAKLTLYGEASLGVLNVGGRPASIYDSRYAFSQVGFRPVVRIPLLNETEELPMIAGAYEQNGVHGRRVPFSFQVSDNNLAHLREIAPSLKLISSDVETTLDGLKSHIPTMLVNVRYSLEATIFHGTEKKQKIEQEIRIWVALDALQVPDPMPDIGEHVTQHRRSSMVSLKRTRSLPFTSARRKSVHDAGNHLIIEAEAPEPFRFTINNDAAAARIEMKLTFTAPDLGDSTPGPMSANIEWLMKSLSTMAVQQTDRSADLPPSEDYFHLRTRHLPVKKSKITWNKWQRPGEDEALENAWTCTQDVWLTLSTKSGLTPTFRTSFLSHSYSVWMQLNLSGKALKSRSYKVELNIPVKLRYDVGLAPGYTVDQGLPSYEVDEGTGTQQPGPGPEHPLEPPPAHEDADEHIHRTPAPRPRYTIDELSDLVRNTGIRGTVNEPLPRRT